MSPADASLIQDSGVVIVLGLLVLTGGRAAIKWIVERLSADRLDSIALREKLSQVEGELITMRVRNAAIEAELVVLRRLLNESEATLRQEEEKITELEGRVVDMESTSD